MVRGRYKTWKHPLYRVMTRVEFEQSGCWTFQGYRLRGYGLVPNDVMSSYAHRITYETIVGPVAPKLDLDHLCRNRACVNPDHLEPVTHQENMMRGRAAEVHPHTAAQRAQTHCKRGHEFTPENTSLWHGHRHCRICEKARLAAYAHR